jgi:predicted HAD superfamily Cof-like phosphohydrolase
MSNFDKVLEFNKAFGVTTNTTSQYNLFDTDTKLVNYRKELILEEVDELKDAIEKKDFVETIDALTDILYVVYGAFSAFGVNADKAFDIVQKSNMSKLCSS